MTAEFIDVLADVLLPGDAHWPSGAELDLTESVRSLSALVPGHTESMFELEQTLGSDFIGEPFQRRHAALAAVEGERPDLFGVARLVVFDAYYRHPRVLVVLADRCGYRGEPPQPAGFPFEDFDPSVLATVRTMAKRWRDDATSAV